MDDKISPDPRSRAPSVQRHRRRQHAVPRAARCARVRGHGEGAFTHSGWLRTGDTGTLDATGRLKVVDRKKDMIIVLGFKVYPAEIEDVVAQLPGVADCAAIGMADMPIAHCRARLTACKCPKVVEFRPSLPKTPIGKVLKRELREPNHAAPTPGVVT